ncbi:GNAT family protein [Brevibacterium salitolerans]|uniref:GNAT family protein n=1 Tax=Brevibacterium salitolerans TaxID=1403566 RepID=A0ABN2WHZ0_9MICO
MGSSPLWPVELSHGEVLLRPHVRGDRRAYKEVRAANVQWLRPWEATVPDPLWSRPDFAEMRRLSQASARQGRSLPFAIDIGGRFRGQLTVSGFEWGSLASAHLGYWIDRREAGRGHVPLAVALAVDHCFAHGLHRMEIAIRPENAASLRVVEKLGFRREGLRERYMHIDGDWRDHLVFSLLSEDVPFGLLAWYLRQRRWEDAEEAEH